MGRFGLLRIRLKYFLGTRNDQAKPNLENEKLSEFGKMLTSTPRNALYVVEENNQFVLYVCVRLEI